MTVACTVLPEGEILLLNEGFTGLREPSGQGPLAPLPLPKPEPDPIPDPPNAPVQINYHQ